MGAGSPFAPYIERWNQLPRARQLILGGIAAATLVAIYFFFIVSKTPTMVVAYSGLAPEDSAAIADQLQSDGVPYKIEGGGSSVSVPVNQVAEVRIKLAQAGLPKGGSVGLEIFDKTNFGATDFVQQVNYQRGLEGELARSINTLDGVKASRVHIVLPTEAIFSEDQKKTTASVVLQLKPGANLNQDQIHGITNLVTNSVEGLEQGGVTIIDETGHVLFDGATFDSPFSTGATGSQMDLQRQYEASLQNDVQETLSKVVGPGRSAVTVRATLNFDKVTAVEDKFGTADQAVPRSSTTSTETYSGNNLNVGNVPGTGTNGGTGGTSSTTANGDTTYTKTDTTTNNEINKTTSTTVKAPGSVDKLSVSVVLDESVTAAQEASITSAVAAAVGLDQVRGDTLSVTRLPFDESAVQDLLPAASDGIGTYLSYLKLVLPMLAVVLGFILVMLLLRSLSKRQLMLPAPAQSPMLAAAAAFAALPSAHDEMPALQPAQDPHEDRVLRLADANPRAVADVVQTWMREEE
jgi:flagellar M-ring protein FliF